MRLRRLLLALRVLLVLTAATLAGYLIGRLASGGR
jgi:hypothetical protein